METPGKSGPKTIMGPFLLLPILLGTLLMVTGLFGIFAANKSNNQVVKITTEALGPTLAFQGIMSDLNELLPNLLKLAHANLNEGQKARLLTTSRSILAKVKRKVSEQSKICTGKVFENYLKNWEQEWDAFEADLRAKLESQEKLRAEMPEIERSVEQLLEKITNINDYIASDVQEMLVVFGKFTQRSRQGLILVLALGLVIGTLSSVLIVKKIRKFLFLLSQKSQQIARQNETIKTIYENVKSGFLIIDQEGAIQGGFTNSCRELLGPQIAAGTPLVDYLQMPESKRKHFQVMIEQVFEDFLPEDFSISQIPSRHNVGDKVIKLEASVIRSVTGAVGTEGPVKGILFTITDTTDQQRTEVENQTNLSLIKILNEKDLFINYVFETRNILREIKEIVDTNQNRVRTCLHTLKGNSGLFNLEQLRQLIHEIEEKTSIELRDIARVESALNSFLERHQKGLNLSLDRPPREVHQVDHHKLDQLRAIVLGSTQQVSVKDQVLAWIHEVKLRPLREVLRPYKFLVDNLSRRLKKKVNFIIENEDLLVDSELLGPVLQNLSHLIGNAIDHGIEPPQERGNKSQEGQIRMAVKRPGAGWKIILSDDGKGIDSDQLVAKAIKLGHLSPEEAGNMSEEDKLALIFKHGFSTREVASTLSGRGLGLAAVLESIQAKAGKIQVKSSKGQGTVFEVDIPAENISRTM